MTIAQFDIMNDECIFIRWCIVNILELLIDIVTSNKQSVTFYTYKKKISHLYTVYSAHVSINGIFSLWVLAYRTRQRVTVRSDRFVSRFTTCP